MLDKNFNVFNKKKGDNMGEEKQLVIRVTSRLIERIIFVVIILILLAIIIFQMMNGPVVDTNTTTTTLASSDTTTTTAAAATSTTATTLAGATTTTRASTTTTTRPAGASDLKDKVTLKFTSDPDISSTGKVNQINFEIKNNADVKFVPRIEFLWYDSGSVEEKNIIRAKWTYDYGIEPGATKTAYQSLFTPSFVDKDLREETFVMNLYNLADGKLIATVSKTLNVG